MGRIPAGARRIQQAQHQARTACTGAVAGTTIRPTSSYARGIATTATRPSAAATSAFVVPGLHKLLSPCTLSFDTCFFVSRRSRDRAIFFGDLNLANGFIREILYNHPSQRLKELGNLHQLKETIISLS